MESMLGTPVLTEEEPRTALSQRLRLPDWLVRASEQRWAGPAAFGALVVVSTLLRLRGMHFYLWIDEAISVGIASHPLGQLPGLLKHDGAPPLWYALLHVWMSIFGQGSVATHMLSLLFAQLCIPACWWAARPAGRRAAIFTSVLAAGVPYISSYGEETRMYSLMVLWSILVAGSLVRAFIQRRRAYLPLFVVSLTAGMYTHNWGLFLAVASACAIVACIWLAPRSARAAILRDGIIGLGATFVLYLPWLPTTLFQAAHTGAPWAAYTTLWTWTQGLYFIAGGRDAATVLFVAGVVGLFGAFVATPRHGPFRREVVALALLVWVTFGEGWFLGKLDPSFSARYEAAVVGPLLLLVGLALSRSGRVAILALVICCVWWLIDPKPSALVSKSNVAAVSAQAATVLNSQSLVISTQPEQVPTLHHYLPQVRRFATPVGVPAHDYAVDWVNLVSRLESRRTHGELHRLLATVHPGQTVAMVIPLGLASGEKYLKLVNQFSTKWWTFMEHDPQFHRLLSTRRYWWESGNPVELAVYRRR